MTTVTPRRHREGVRAPLFSSTILAILMMVGIVPVYAQVSIPPDTGPVMFPVPRSTDRSEKSPEPDTTMTAQLVSSRRGYVARIPAVARLDSARSGWQPVEKYEVRTYVIDGAGEIIFRVTVDSAMVPGNAVREGAYLVLDHDSVTTSGTAYTRTYYLPTRQVTITLKPYGVGMRTYTELRQLIFASFRWKTGAETDRELLEEEGRKPPEVTPVQGFGG